MSDYINRKQLIKALSDGWNVMDDQDFCNKGVWHIVQEFPAANVVERKHGEWRVAFFQHESFGERPTAFYCSECYQIIAFRTFYCPNCGAEMRGDSDV